MKLNLGSGKDYRKGYVNVDINKIFKADVYADILSLDYPEGSVDEVLASDILDQVTLVEAKKLLRNIYKWLKSRGVLHVHLPDLATCGLLAVKGNTEALRWLYGSTGEGSAFYETNWKKWAYTQKSFRALLEPLGFKILEMTSTCRGYGFRCIAVKEGGG